MEKERKIKLDDIRFQDELFGNFYKNVKIIEKFYNINIILRSGEIVLVGEDENTQKAEKLLLELAKIVEDGDSLNTQNINYSIDLLEEMSDRKLSDLKNDTIIMTAKGNVIKAKTIGQQNYIDNINSKDITICIGPAGTGKTYLAVAMAVRAFKMEEVSRIILTRPAVEAGESLGFLPGDLKEKVDPYLRPLYDALFDIMGSEKFLKLMEREIIEVAPLAYMRGRTLDNSFIILDEAQNTSGEQMKMFLTRLGFGSKAVVTGDITQIDLPSGKKSGLVSAAEILKNIDQIGINRLNEKDVVRHELVQKIIKAYEKYELRETEKNNGHSRMKKPYEKRKNFDNKRRF